MATASYVVFRTPLEFMSRMDVLDSVLLRALKMEKDISLHTLID